MEIGNIVFGHPPQGDVFEVPREWEDYLELLHSASHTHIFIRGETSEVGYKDSEVILPAFEFHPYYWGECFCGYQEKEDKWSEENDHSITCYQTEYMKRIESARTDANLIVSFDTYATIGRELCEKHGIPWNDGLGAAVHCTCDFESRWAAFCRDNKHDEHCPIVLPNFWYKPSDFKIWWYKYPLRDAYMNHNLSGNQFLDILIKCVESLREEQTDVAQKNILQISDNKE